MTARRPRDIGTVAESAVVRALHGLGFPHAERRQLRGIHDAGDITGTLGVCWSVKGGVAAKTASDGLVARWLVELDRQRVNAAAGVGVLVLQRAGIGVANAGRWWAVVRHGELCCGVVDGPPVRLLVADACRLLRNAGYGDPAMTGAALRAPETVQGVSEYPDGTNGALAAHRPPAIGYGDEP